MRSLTRMTVAETPEDPGTHHLVWIGRFMLILWPLGALAWLFRSPRASLAFAAGGATSLVFWGLHRWTVRRMLTPSVRRRWFFALLGLVKLALIVLLLRGITTLLPWEILPLATGILLFVSAILMEALRLLLWPEAGAHD